MKMKIISMSQAWGEEKNESPTGIKPMTSQTPGGHSIHLSYRELIKSKATY